MTAPTLIDGLTPSTEPDTAWIRSTLAHRFPGAVVWFGAFTQRWWAMVWVEGADAVLCGLVAYHSCAINEAEERGLAAELAEEFSPARRFLADALTYCDMTTTPDGEPVAVEDRLGEIERRYGAGHLVTRFIRRSSAALVGAVRTIESARALGDLGSVAGREEAFDPFAHRAVHLIGADVSGGYPADVA